MFIPSDKKGSTFTPMNTMTTYVGFMMVGSFLYATHKFYNDRKRLGKLFDRKWKSKYKNRMTQS